MMERWYNKLLLNHIRRAIDDYDMIDENEKVIVGLSGEKDSALLLYSLNLINKYSHKKFQVLGVHLDCGFDIDRGPLRRFCSKMNIDFHVEETNIIYCLDIEEEKNSCCLYGRLRRGAHC